MDGIAELIENNRLVRGMCFASGLLWVASFAFYTIGPSIVERSELRRAAARTSGKAAGKGNAMPALILVLLMALVTSLEGAATYLGVPGELMFPIAVFTLVGLIFVVAQAFQWATGTGEW